MNVLKKELMTAQYQSLKDQISPHFLFNSLNTLTSLMYQDRDLASDFVSRLASCYRYILDNREKLVVSRYMKNRYKPHYAFNENKVWVYDSPVIVQKMRKNKDGSVLTGNR